MKKILFILLMTAILKVNADMGPPSIQAVCKVTTSDGKTYEGFITLINGGLHGIHQNGFYFYLDDHYRWTSLFDYEFHKLEKNETKLGISRYRFGGFAPDAKRIHFLAYIIDRDNYWLTETKNEVKEKSRTYLITEKIVRRKYLMLDTLPLFTELPKYLHLDYQNKKVKRYNIPMKDIVSLEIVLQPSQQLMEEIEKKRKICFAEVYGPESTGDFLEPAWVHELMNRPEELKRLKDEFKEWGIR